MKPRLLAYLIFAAGVGAWLTVLTWWLREIAYFVLEGR